MFALTALVPRRGSHCAPTPANAVLDLPALVGATGWSRLPPAVQHRFAAVHTDVTYDGHMDLRCSFAGRIFAALARVLGGPLTDLNALSVPTSVRVCSNLQGGVVWERCFHAGAHARGDIVRSTKELGADGGLWERTDGGLSMSLKVFEQDGTLLFLSHRFWLALGAVRLPVPAWLTPGVCRVVHTDLGAGLFRYTLSMVHPLWGETFHQSGVFADRAFCG